MKKGIDRIDKHLLYELDWNARQSDTALAKKIGRSKENVRYRIKKLEKKGIIKGYIVWINPNKLGYRGYKTYLKIGGKEKEIEEFYNELKKRTDIFWFGIANGGWDLALVFFAKTNEDFFKRQNEFFSKYNQIILQKSTGAVVNSYQFSKTFLCPQQKKYFQLFGKLENNKLDKIDKRILSELFINSRIKLVDLAKKTKTTVDIARNRIKKLEKNGIIVRYKAMIDYQNKLGIELYKSFLYFDSFSNEDEARLFEIVKQDPTIVHEETQISSWEIELEVMVENHKEYNEVIRKLKAAFPNLRNVESAIVSVDYMFPAKETIEKL